MTVTRSPEPDAELEARVTQLLNEVRNTLLGVQVLLAGLIAIPFTPAFASLPDFDRRLYLIAVCAAVAASALLVAPAQYHRIRFHHRSRPETLRLGRWLASTGSVCLALAVTAVLGLLTRAVDERAAIPVVAAAAVLVTVLWFAVPLAGRGAQASGERTP